MATRARILADYVSSGDELALKAPLASPAFTGTPTGITAADLEAGVLPSDVTGGSGLTALGTVATGNLSNTAIVYPAGHVLQTVTSSNTTQTNFGSGTAYDLMTDFAVTITPNFSNSKIIIIFNCGIMIDGTVNNVFMKVTGTTTGEVMRQNQWGYINQSDWSSHPLAVNAIDTPGTTAAQTYQLFLGTGASVTDSSARLNSEGNTNSGTVIAIEIKV